MSQYNAEELFHSVTDIFAQLDEGEISETIANEILLKCCKEFIYSNQSKQLPP